MRRALLGLLVALTATSPSLAGPQEDAKAAFDRGDHSVALGLYRTLAEAGDPVAQFRLGTMYDLGRGAAQNYALAAQWYRRAADQGYAAAQHNLGHMYEAGHGLPGEYALAAAAAWYARAADQGYAPSQGNLGILYAKGRGVRRDLVQAYKWFTLAGVMENREYVARLMTPRQIAQAERLATEWQAKLERINSPPASSGVSR